MPSRNYHPLSIAILPFIFVFLNSCTTENINPSAIGAPSESAKQLAAEIAQIKKQQPRTNEPVAVVVAIDQSGSMESARVSFVTTSDFAPILKKLEQSGGEIAVSAICDRSNRPLTRIPIAPPPKLDEKILTLPTPPAPLAEEGSPFEKEEREKAHKDQLADYNNKVDETRKLFADFKLQQQQYRTETDKRLTEIKPQIEAILVAPRNCVATDIQNSIGRANLFLAEPSWKKGTRRFALFITDGLDSFSQAPANLPPDAKVILVNGSTNVGIFNKIAHDRFESPKQAIAHLAGLI